MFNEFSGNIFMDGLVAELGSWIARCSGQSSAWGVRSSERWPIQPLLRDHQQAQKLFKSPTLHAERISQVPNQSLSTPQGVKWCKWESSWHPEQPGGWTATCWCVLVFTSLCLTPPHPHHHPQGDWQDLAVGPISNMQLLRARCDPETNLTLWQSWRWQWGEIDLNCVTEMMMRTSVGSQRTFIHMTERVGGACSTSCRNMFYKLN